MKRLIALALAALMLLSACALAESDVTYLDYHDYSQFPLVADGEDVTISVGRYKNSTYGIDADQTWFWNFASQASGLKFEFEEVLDTALIERKTLLFASGELPDVMIGFEFTTEELMRYGAGEGQLLALNDYINEDVMPNLSQWIAAYPQILDAITASDGNIYSLPILMKMNYTTGQSEPLFLKKTVMDELGLGIPETLNDFTALLRAMKAAQPDSIPLAGGADASDPRSYILNALGYLTASDNDIGSEVAVKDGAAVIPAATQDFKEYLEVLHQYYAEGLISEDFFTLDSVGVNADVAEGLSCAFAAQPYTATPEVEQFQQWVSCKPLTSDVNSVQQWKSVDTVNVGGGVLSADTQHAEVILRWMDFYFSSLGGTYLWGGPLHGSPDTLGIIEGYHYNGDGTFTYHPKDDGYENNWAYFNAIFGGFPGAFGNQSHPLEYEEEGATSMMQFLMMEETGVLEGNHWDPANGDNFARMSMGENIDPYEVAGFPTVVYFNPAVSDRINEIKSVLEPHIESEVAKFITGARDLSEFDQFQQELKDLDVEEYQRYYADYYTQYTSGK